MDHIFAGVKWTCTACGAAQGSCNCWTKCECGRSVLRGEECSNSIWHTAKSFAQDAADQKVVDDMASSYKLFKRQHMADRLWRAVVRQTHPILIATFEGVESAKKSSATPTPSGEQG